MKIANGMDSVFDNTSDSLLNFELMFDEDDTLIDLVAGVKENGEWVTGPDPESLYEFVYPDTIEEGDCGPVDTLTDKCDTGRREGLKDQQAPAEGSVKDADKKFYDGNEGMDKPVPGTGTSAESKSHEDDEKDAEKALTKEAAAPEDNLTDKDDEAVRDGKEKYASNNVEGEKQEVVGAALEAKKDVEVCEACGKPLADCTCNIAESILASLDATVEAFDPSSKVEDSWDKQIKNDKDKTISDKDDEAVRDGKEKYASNNVEGEKQEVVGAALESDNIDDELSDPTTVPDKVQNDGAANVIPPDAETQSSVGMEPATEDVEFDVDDILESFFDDFFDEACKSEACDSADSKKEDKKKEEDVKEACKSEESEPSDGDDEDIEESIIYMGWLNDLTEASDAEKLAN